MAEQLNSSKGAGPDNSWLLGSPQIVSGLRQGSATASWQPSLLGRANQDGELFAADVHVATALGRLGNESDQDVLLAVARTVAAAREGSSCWQVDPPKLAAVLAESPLVVAGEVGDDHPAVSGAGRPLRLVEDLLYLDRFWRDERQVARQILARSASDPAVDVETLRESLGHGRFRDEAPDRQRVATALAVLRNFTVIAGGPGTGKTTTVARILAAMVEQPGPRPRVALAAPTGKAAARLQSSIAEQADRLGPDLGELRASTIHRLLGYRPGSSPRHGGHNPLPHDVVIVDETSMVSLPLLARVLDAVRPDARLILVGDPDQLASVEVGAVLADLVERPATDQPDPRLSDVVGLDLMSDHPSVLTDSTRGVVRLDRGYRNNTEIAALAQCIQAGDVVGVLRILHDPAMPSVKLIRIDDGTDLVGEEALADVRRRVVEQSVAAAAAATAGHAGEALEILAQHQILTAHRTGPYGALRWANSVVRATAQVQPGYGSRFSGDPNWYVGRPVIVTRNDEDTGLSNGDVGIAMLRTTTPGTGGTEPLGLTVALDVGDIVEIHPGRMPEHLPLQAITVHRAQGSQYAGVTVVLPEENSALLTRELLYTAVTRAREHVVILGTEESLACAVNRRAGRASGLRRAQAW